MPKVIRWIVFIFLAVINGFLVCSVSVGVIKNMYTPVKLLYLGKAEGEWDENFTGSLSTCREYKFYYSNFPHQKWDSHIEKSIL